MNCINETSKVLLSTGLLGTGEAGDLESYHSESHCPSAPELKATAASRLAETVQNLAGSTCINTVLGVQRV